ncbi:hypothetical protein ACFQJ7_16485 [Halovenus rubra]|uniref:Halobacterial output domain-containing protein n=2 Tax=Halovenus rubra TaxID=869890 RepID=A0ABD5XH50_9EURY|nr:hypothetical protein [Halovenus rubra]
MPETPDEVDENSLMDALSASMTPLAAVDSEAAFDDLDSVAEAVSDVDIVPDAVRRSHVPQRDDRNPERRRHARLTKRGDSIFLTVVRGKFEVWQK